MEKEIKEFLASLPVKNKKAAKELLRGVVLSTAKVKDEWHRNGVVGDGDVLVSVVGGKTL